MLLAALVASKARYSHKAPSMQQEKMIPRTPPGSPSYYECTVGTGSVGQCAPPPQPDPAPWEAAPLTQS